MCEDPGWVTIAKVFFKDFDAALRDYKIEQAGSGTTTTGASTSPPTLPGKRSRPTGKQ